MQVPIKKKKVLIQFQIDEVYKEQVEGLQAWHKGLLSHLARQGFIKECDALIASEQQEKKAS